MLKKRWIILLFLALFLTVTTTAATNNLVSVNENNIIISSPEIVYCKGTLCEFMFTVENLTETFKYML